MDLKKLLSELARRNVFRAVVAYLAVAWVLIQIADTILPAFGAPPYILKGLIYLLAIGLVFWVGFSWVYDLTPQGFRKTDDLEEGEEVQQHNNRRLNQVILGAGLTAVMLLVGASFWAGSQWKNVHFDSFKRIAVIPLNPQQTEATEYEITGFTDGIIKTLSALDDLTVLSLASSRYLAAGVAPTGELYAEGVSDIDYFLFGTYSLQGKALTLDLELSEGLDKASFWQKQYRKDLSEARRLWAEIAGDVSGLLGLESGEANRVLERTIRPVDPETYELYLKGKHYLNKSQVEDWARALVYFQEAVDKNPADPYAYAGLAEGYISLGHSLMPPPDVFPKALAASKRAIQLDSANAEGWAALSHYHTYFGWDWELAEYAFKRADALNPNMAYNHYHRSWYLALFDRMEEAIEEHKRAKEIDPFSAMHTAWLGGLYCMNGDYELALQEADLASVMEDDYALSNVIRGWAHMGLGRKEEALAALEAAARVNPGWRYFAYGPALFSYGYRDKGREIIKEVEGLPESPFFALCLAILYHADRDFEKTFEWLEKGKRHAWYPWTVRIFTASEAMMADSRHHALMAELDLPPAVGPSFYALSPQGFSD